LVGSLAYQTYTGILGARLPGELMRTEDVDVAQFYGVSAFIEDQMPDLGDLLKAVDPTFGPVFAGNGGNLISAFRNATGFKIEFLTPNRGAKEFSMKLARMPALGPSIGAQVLRYLDFLIREPVRSVLLHESGVGVLVPAPERYAVHKLIVATQRTALGAEKASKDIDQASALIDAFDLRKRNADLGFSWIEAWKRGRGWQRRLALGAMRLSDERFAKLSEGVMQAAKLEGNGGDRFGLGSGREGLLSAAGKSGKAEPE
jgi:hypothetical protein